MALSGTGWELWPPLLRTSRRRSRYHFSAACISFEMRLSFANWPLPPSFSANSASISHRRRTLLVRSENTEALGGVFHRDSGLLRDILGDFQILLSNGALFVQKLGTRQLRTRQSLVRHRLPVVRECRGSIGALDAQQELPLRHRISQPGVDFQNAAGSQ